jgi:crotonobetainyl-CoA:carnitine CoA-transferase CaiB-like acyl-CoA transferase
LSAPLSHLKVLEVAAVLAGPSTSTFLAELGAQVIKIENSTTGGDVTRSWRLPSEEDPSQISAYYASANYGKQVLQLDLKSEEGRLEMQKHLQDSDILISSFRPDSASRLGLAAEQIKSLHPKIIYAQVLGFSGGSKRPAYDLVVQAESGYMDMNGDENPQRMPVALMDVLAAHQLKEAILLALLERSRSGLGQYVEVNLMDSALSSLANQASNYLMQGFEPRSQGGRHPNIAPYGEPYRCMDERFIVLAIGSDKQFQKLCAVLKLDRLSKDERFLNNPSRVINRAALEEQLQAAFSNRQSAQVYRELLDAEIPAGLVRKISEVLNAPEHKHMIISDLNTDSADRQELRRMRQKAFTIRPL